MQKVMKTVRNGKNVRRLGTLALERSNALERIVENAQGTFRFTLQERKNNCN
jgi:hypothetical protein